MVQIYLEESSSFAHTVFALSAPPAFFDIRLPRHPVSCELTAGLDMPLPSSSSVLAYQHGQRSRQLATAYSQKE